VSTVKVDNKHLTVASCWVSISLHNLLTMHGHRNLKITVNIIDFSAYFLFHFISMGILVLLNI